MAALLVRYSVSGLAGGENDGRGSCGVDCLIRAGGVMEERSNELIEDIEVLRRLLLPKDS